jgi:prepilin-type N-terminal cleavage/methylation domain-containing protein
MKTHQPNPPSTQGYSLLELVLVLAIVSVLVGLLLPKGFDALRNARIQQVEKTVDTLKTALTDYLSMAGGNGSLPRTEGTGIPTSGARSPAPPMSRRATPHGSTPCCSPRAKSNAAQPAHGHAVLSPPRAPATKCRGARRARLRDDAGRRAAAQLVGRHARRGPHRQSGARAFGRPRRQLPPRWTTNLNANYVVAYLVIPACPAKDAYELAVAMNGAQLAPVEGAASDSWRRRLCRPRQRSHRCLCLSHVHLSRARWRLLAAWGDRWWILDCTLCRMSGPTRGH